MTAPLAPVGLIAGWGRFPVYFARKAQAAGIPVVCIGLRGMANREEIEPFCSKFYWSGFGTLSRPIRCWKREGITRWTMAGKFHKTAILSPWLPLRVRLDLRMIRFWYRHSRRDNKDDTILLSLIDEFARDGLVCTSALDLCPELLVKQGTLTRRPASESELADIDFGWTLAREMGRLDVGQSVMVKNRMVLAVEAIEGTDQAILRAGLLCRAGGFTVVKVAKPDQDMRFDVPTVGRSTIETIHEAGGRVLAVEAGKTICLDEAETVALADKLGITIIARDDGPVAAG